MKTFNNETYVIEHWRQKYLIQAFIVLVIIGSLVGTSCYVVQDLELKLLFVLIGISVTYLMIKELRNDLQTRAETLLLSPQRKKFQDISFDYGKGIEEHVLQAQEVVDNYQVRECHNVMSGKKFVLEEDWFYSVVSSKFFPLTQTAFQGMVLEITDVSETLLGKKGKIYRQDGKLNISGSLAEVLKKQEIQSALVSLLQLLLAKKITAVAQFGKIYFWFATDKALFYQYSLLTENSLGKFNQRIENINKNINQIVSALNG